MTDYGKPLVCPHGHKIGVTIDPAEYGLGADYIIYRARMAICQQCALDAVSRACMAKDQKR